jgi:hypothetical protein
MPEESLNMLIENGQIGQQLPGRSLARAKADNPRIVIHCDQVDLGIIAI